MDKARTEHSEGKINPKFQQLADDFGFNIAPCVRARPNTKAKVENPMRIIDEIMTYNGLLNDESLITNEANSRIFQATGVPPICAFKNDHQISIVEALYELTSKEVKVKDFKAVNPMIKGVKRF
ncbi:hypothetical protein SAMN04487886_109512 [Clostridium sp. DSM 8431]|nr:hypothetical protein SAMN04487886_109512 [Clostridium sp. DSM 8431]